jgi:hypothetical protein
MISKGQYSIQIMGKISKLLLTLVMLNVHLLDNLWLILRLL